MSKQLTCWRFHAVDSWFFRETRAHDAVGVSELSSVFPPPARTLMGAIRTWLGDQLGVDWSAFSRGEAQPSLQSLLGDADHLGELSLAVVVLRHGGETLWPCPADVMLGEHDGKVQVSRLVPGSAVESDLGRVALPTVAAGTPLGSKVVEGAWLTAEGMMTWLEGGVPTVEQIVTLDALVEEEPRLGIGRDNRSGTVKPGLLYQTRHLRLRDESTCVEAWVSGVPGTVIRDATSQQTLRLGGEGRMASVNLSEEARLPLPESVHGKGERLALWLIAPALIAEADASSGLPGFMPITTADGLDVWEGDIEGVALRLVSSCRPRAFREGGWDQRLRRPRPVRSYLAPGTVLFCEIRDDTPMGQALERLNGSQIGADGDWGKGRILASAIDWPDPNP
ncbi:type III-B CRISPR module-associated Cmr3 family protein [Halomonas lysinitropha]|uniref:CRISPR-associated protein (Cas_Cmr3) n=1 Tax=Halomonas lysinitropha TaxID=2607506 RepID=A0A5K1I3M4_9GAMM|nr:type III-B CRISPR module-associated Cmr3 family protein [Halomonas lysinitropha]VVZ94633.1 CRISPR-associated protein (Cas_Cmr3) [Halomonas lysinitropha]